MVRRIGITMRSCSAQEYNEPRDGLARDWYAFFQAIGLPNNWILLPNLGIATLDYMKVQQIDAVILSGGDDLGHDPVRDLSEQLAIQYCRKLQLPLLGVCRGLQLMCTEAGGKLQAVSPEVHRVQRHTIHFTDAFPVNHSAKIQNTMVNSYHNQGLALPLPEEYEAMAWFNGECEAIRHKQLRWAGIMWHPEREATCHERDRQLFHWLFE